MSYFAKMRGGAAHPPRVGLPEIFWSFVGAMAGIGLVAWLHEDVVGPAGLTMLIGSFGASAVLLYGAPKSPLAQPRNLLGGHFLSALFGVAVRLCLPGPHWLVCALATPSPRAGEATVAEIMTRPAVCVAPETGRREAARLMAAQGINRLPVIAAGRLCGIVSRGHVARSCRDIPEGCGLGAISPKCAAARSARPGSA